MAGKKKEKDNMLYYKGKPLCRKDNIIYYGSPEDKFLTLLTLEKTETINSLEVATKISVVLQTNDKGRKPQIIKKGEREGLYTALDLAQIWLFDAIERTAENDAK